MGIISAIIIGLIAGALAKLIMPGKDPGGCVVTALLGIAGGVVGQFLGSLIFNRETTEPSPPGLITSVIGAIVLLAIYRLFVGRKRPRD